MQCLVMKAALDFNRGLLRAILGWLMLSFQVQSLLLTSATASVVFKDNGQSPVGWKCVKLTCRDGNKKEMKSNSKIDIFCSNASSGKENRNIAFRVVYNKHSKWCFLSLNDCLRNKNRSSGVYLEGHKIKHSLPWETSKNDDLLNFKGYQPRSPKNGKTLNCEMFFIQECHKHLLSYVHIFYKSRLFLRNQKCSVTNEDLSALKNYIIENNNLTNSTLQYKQKVLSRMRKRKNDFNFARKFRFKGDSSLAHTQKYRIKREARDMDKMVENGGHQESRQKEPTSDKETREAREPSSHISTSKYENIGGMWKPKFNATAYSLFLTKEEMKRKLRMEAEWAYLCMVFLTSLIVFSVWCLRGFHSRNNNKRLVSHSDKDHYLTVKEVLYRKAPYLPMFNHQGPLEEVLVHDCGTNPDS